MNVCLGSALATIGLTIPAVLGIGLITGQEIHLGLDQVDAALLVLTLFVSALTLAARAPTCSREPSISCCSWSMWR